MFYVFKILCISWTNICFIFRFYSHNSSFVHGGVEKPGEEQPPVMGQAVCTKLIICYVYMLCFLYLIQIGSGIQLCLLNKQELELDSII